MTARIASRKLNSMIESFRCETSMLVDCSLPVVYYTTRTHKQLEQVVKEFRRTVYCGKALMTILSSRDNSCLLSLDKSRWSSKNDMCRDCTKVVTICIFFSICNLLNIHYVLTKEGKYRETLPMYNE